MTKHCKNSIKYIPPTILSIHSFQFLLPLGRGEHLVAYRKLCNICICLQSKHKPDWVWKKICSDEYSKYSSKKYLYKFKSRLCHNPGESNFNCQHRVKYAEMTWVSARPPVHSRPDKTIDRDAYTDHVHLAHCWSEMKTVNNRLSHKLPSNWYCSSVRK